MKRNAVGAMAAQPQPANYSETPAHLPTKESHVVVPFYQSVITAGLVSPIIGTIFCVTAYNVYNFTVGGSLLVLVVTTAGSFFIVSCWQWFVSVSHYNQLLWRVEEFFNRDIDGDGITGAPQPRRVSVEVRNGKTWQYATLPGDEISLYNFAQDVVNGIQSFSEAGAQRSGYGQLNFKQLRDEYFIPNHWAEWSSGERSTAGVKLTRSGWSVLRDIARVRPENEAPGGMSDQWVEHGSKRDNWPK